MLAVSNQSLPASPYINIFCQVTIVIKGGGAKSKTRILLSLIFILLALCHPFFHHYVLSINEIVIPELRNEVSGICF